MTPDQAIAIVRQRSAGRTLYEGQEPFVDEVLVAEVERLRAELDAIKAKLPKTADGVTVTYGMTIYDPFGKPIEISRPKTGDYYPVVIREKDGSFSLTRFAFTLQIEQCYSTKEAALAVKELPHPAAEAAMGGGK